MAASVGHIQSLGPLDEWIMRRQTEQQEHLVVFTLSERNTFSSKFYRASFYGGNFPWELSTLDGQMDG